MSLLEFFRVRSNRLFETKWDQGGRSEFAADVTKRPDNILQIRLDSMKMIAKLGKGYFIFNFLELEEDPDNFLDGAIMQILGDLQPFHFASMHESSGGVRLLLPQILFERLYFQP